MDKCFWCDEGEPVLDGFCQKCIDETNERIKNVRLKKGGTGIFGIMKLGYAAIDNRHIELKDLNV